MVILFKTNVFKYNNILRKLNDYWRNLDYPQCKIGVKKKTMFSCERYNFWVSRYSIHISDHYFKLNKKEQEEILTMLNIIFKNKIKGYIDKYQSCDSEDLINTVEKNKNIIKTSSSVSCHYEKNKIEKCKDLIATIPETEENQETLKILNEILDNMHKNAFSKEN